MYVFFCNHVRKSKGQRWRMAPGYYDSHMPTLWYCSANLPFVKLRQGSSKTGSGLISSVFNITQNKLRKYFLGISSIHALKGPFPQSAPSIRMKFRVRVQFHAKYLPLLTKQNLGFHSIV